MEKPSPECYDCPRCGLQKSPERRVRKREHKPRRRRRLPNGFGQITKLNRNLRNPYRAMVTVGKTETGKPICKLLKPQAYFKTYNDAYTALLEYHQNPCTKNSHTVSEVYEEWKNEYEKEMSNRQISSINWVWQYCWPLYDLQINEVNVRKIKDILNNGYYVKNNIRHEVTAAIRVRIMSRLNVLFEYAVENEYTDSNPVAKIKSVSTSVGVANPHMAFSDEEMTVLWSHTDDLRVRLVLIQCYTGMRPQELGLVELQNIYGGYMIGGIKTDAGKDRVIPIHESIKPFINEFCMSGLPRPFTLTNLTMTYDVYRKYFNEVVNELGLDQNHKPHDGRKHFVTMAKAYKVDDFAIKRIVGHSIKDITENVYTERPIDWLIEEIHKIPVRSGV